MCAFLWIVEYYKYYMSIMNIMVLWHIMVLWYGITNLW